jgi:hypothetical protein
MAPPADSSWISDFLDKLKSLSATDAQLDSCRSLVKNKNTADSFLSLLDDISESEVLFSGFQTGEDQDVDDLFQTTARRSKYLCWL